MPWPPWSPVTSTSSSAAAVSATPALPKSRVWLLAMDTQSTPPSASDWAYFVCPQKAYWDVDSSRLSEKLHSRLASVRSSAVKISATLENG